MKVCMVLLLSCLSLGLKLPRPSLPWEVFTREGDIKLGGIFPLHKYAPDTWCSNSLLGTLQTQFVQAMVFAVERINMDPTMLYNLTLGFVIYDDCAREMIALARAMSFVGERDSETYWPTRLETFPSTPQEYSNNATATMTENSSNSAVTVKERSFTFTRTTPSTDVPFHKVIGVVGPMRSLNTILSAELFTLFKTAQISAVSTADDLSDKQKYPYFLRMVPPDQNQAETIVSLMKHFNWSYFSGVYSQGTYGLGGINRVKDLARKAGMCVAYITEISPTATPNDLDDVIRKLRKNGNATAVVIFANAQEAKGLISAAARAKAHREFIWIFSDGLSSLSSLEGSVDVVLGGFMVQMHTVITPDFDDYFQQLNPTNNADSPWFRKFWELYFSCIFDNSSETVCSGKETISKTNGFSQDGRVSLFVDAVSTFALGIQELIKAECYEFRHDKPVLVSCVENGDLIRYMKQLEFVGEVGLVKFDQNGDMLGRYTVKQIVQDNGLNKLQEVALWSAEGGLNIGGEIQWYHKGNQRKNADGVPLSMCSSPCGPGQLVLIQEVSCCWVCHDCRPNEITKPDLKSCLPCPFGFWPDENHQQCLPIGKTFLSLPSVYALVVVVLTTASIAMTAAIVVTFLRHRDNRLIKATSRELSCIILSGVLISFLSVYAFVARPLTGTCIFCRVAFHLSVTISYSALLVRTSRIYRIFEAGKRTNKRPPFISTSSQIIAVLMLIIIQVLIIAVTTVLYPPTPHVTMPVPDTRYAELSCQLPLEGLVIPLAYNLLLIATNTFFGFKIRHLPANFNESKCIFVCVCTTLFIFIAFLPTYFASFYTYHKSMLLCLCLIINADVIILMLFLPRVYALYWLDDKAIEYASDGAANSSITGRSVRATNQRRAKANQVAPPDHIEEISVHTGPMTVPSSYK